MMKPSAITICGLVLCSCSNDQLPKQIGDWDYFLRNTSYQTHDREYEGYEIKSVPFEYTTAGWRPGTTPIVFFHHKIVYSQGKLVVACNEENYMEVGVHWSKPIATRAYMKVYFNTYSRDPDGPSFDEYYKDLTKFKTTEDINTASEKRKADYGINTNQTTMVTDFKYSREPNYSLKEWEHVEEIISNIVNSNGRFVSFGGIVDEKNHYWEYLMFNYSDFKLVVDTVLKRCRDRERKS